MHHKHCMKCLKEDYYQVVPNPSTFYRPDNGMHHAPVLFALRLIIFPPSIAPRYSKHMKLLHVIPILFTSTGVATKTGPTSTKHNKY
jgi:hypothetical protein